MFVKSFRILANIMIWVYTGTLPYHPGSVKVQLQLSKGKNLDWFLELVFTRLSLLKRHNQVSLPLAQTLKPTLPISNYWTAQNIILKHGSQIWAVDNRFTSLSILLIRQWILTNLKRIKRRCSRKRMRDFRWVKMRSFKLLIQIKWVWKKIWW